MRIVSIAAALVGILPTLQATTLQKLTVDEMIQKSTAIVRAKVVSSYGAFRGQEIYTHYQLEVEESWKSAGPQQIEVAIPGGVSRGLRQTVAGAPSLNVGSDYVIFLWTSRSGLTQVIGLSQGLFNVNTNAAGDLVLIRPSITELILDRSGHVVNDQSITMTLAALRSEIQQVLGGAK
jgi:hypothetical protein